MASSAIAAAVDHQRLEQFMNTAVTDLGAAMHAAIVLIGDKLGLYKAMAGQGPVSAQELADHTGTSERYVREWLNANAAAAYVKYHADTGKYELPAEVAFALAVEDSPVYLSGAYHILASCFKDEAKIIDVFRSGEGLGWHQHHSDLHLGTERFFRPNYSANLISSWIPALEGVEEKLKRGARVADVGCGYGSSTIIMAQAYPNSEFWGFDYHQASINHARHASKQAGVDGRTHFSVAVAKDFFGMEYDLVACFDCLHDMGDPVGAARHIREAMAPDGVWMIVEPYANDQVEQNLNPVGRIYYAASTMICTPASKAQEVGLALGAQAGEARIREVVLEGGFTRFRRAAETPFNLVLEARP